MLSAIGYGSFAFAQDDSIGRLLCQCAFLGLLHAFGAFLSGAPLRPLPNTKSIAVTAPCESGIKRVLITDY